MVQWLGLLTFTAEGAGSFPGGELRFHKPHSTAKLKVCACVCVYMCVCVCIYIYIYIKYIKSTWVHISLSSLKET